METSGIAPAARLSGTANGPSPKLLNMLQPRDACWWRFCEHLLRQAERVRVGCIAQIVNVIAPLVTNETSVLRQSIYYPYAWALKYARGKVLDLRVESETYPIKAEGLRVDFDRDDQVPLLDVVATMNPQDGQVSVFMLNRDLHTERELSWIGAT